MPLISLRDQGYYDSSDQLRQIVQTMLANRAAEEQRRQRAQQFVVDQQTKQAQLQVEQEKARIAQQQMAAQLAADQALAEKQRADAARSTGTLGADISRGLSDAEAAQITAELARRTLDPKVQEAQALAEKAQLGNLPVFEDTTVTPDATGGAVTRTTKSLGAAPGQSGARPGGVLSKYEKLPRPPANRVIPLPGPFGVPALAQVDPVTGQTTFVKVPDEFSGLGPPPAKTGIPGPLTPQQAAALPSGTKFLGTDGKQHTRK